MGDDNFDFDKLFDSIAENFDGDDLSDPRFPQLSAWEINRAIVGMNEVSTYLGRYILQCADKNGGVLAGTTSSMVRELIRLTGILAEELSVCYCPECVADDCPDCTNDEICEDCLRDIEEEYGDNDD